MTKQNRQGFSLVELLITLAIMTALSGIGLAVYAQYQKRAYNTTALQQGFQLRNAFEAGMADRSSNASTLFGEVRLLSYNIAGELTCASGCSGINLNTIFPGFEHQSGVNLVLNMTTSPSYSIQVGHCKALATETEYDGWILTDDDEALRAAVPAVANEISQCSQVLSGEELQAEVTAIPTPTPLQECDPSQEAICSSGGGFWCDNTGSCSAYGSSSPCSCTCGPASGPGYAMSWQGDHCGCSEGDVGDGMGGCCAPGTNCGCSGQNEIRNAEGFCVEGTPIPDSTPTSTPESTPTATPTPESTPTATPTP